MIKKIEPGCMAIVIDGYGDPAAPTNIGKITKITACLGTQINQYGKEDDVWGTDQPMATKRTWGDGRVDFIETYKQLGCNLQRIDDEGLSGTQDNVEELSTEMV